MKNLSMPDEACLVEFIRTRFRSLYSASKVNWILYFQVIFYEICLNLSATALLANGKENAIVLITLFFEATHQVCENQFSHFPLTYRAYNSCFRQDRNFCQMKAPNKIIPLLCDFWGDRFRIKYIKSRLRKSAAICGFSPSFSIKPLACVTRNRKRKLECLVGGRDLLVQICISEY